MEAIQASGIGYAIFFYNPNIHPLKEYELRKQENIRFAQKHGVPFIDADYDTDNWFARARGMEQEPERGIRCTMCFDMRFERTALYAHEHGYTAISSSLGDFALEEHGADQPAAAIAPRGATRGWLYWDYNWRKKGGSQRMIEISKRENFYQQEYCGCVYSLRDTNRAPGSPPAASASTSACSITASRRQQSAGQAGCPGGESWLNAARTASPRRRHHPRQRRFGFRPAAGASDPQSGLTQQALGRYHLQGALASRPRISSAEGTRGEWMS